jgi:hypothetical protein
MRKPKHTCIDELIDVLDEKRWAEAMLSRVNCPACQARRAALSAADREKLNQIDAGILAKALKATGKARVSIIRSEPKIKKGKVRI